MTTNASVNLFRNAASLAGASTIMGFGMFCSPGSARGRKDGCCATTDCEPSIERQSSSRLIFLGTGSSTGCPRPGCPLLFSDKAPSNDEIRALRQDFASHCEISNLAMKGGDPKLNKNYRNNPSLLISVDSAETGKQTNVIIDVGKTFREGALRWLPDHGIATLDAIILTHQHMDAAAGLDDVRGFQKYENIRDRYARGKHPTAVPMPLFLSEECYLDVRERFPWLLPKPQITTPTTKPLVQRHVASFDVTVFEKFRPFSVQDGALTIVPLPVMHGEDLVSFGFAFTVGQTNVVYLSDISRMLPETLNYIRHRLPPTDILVLDALHPKRRNPVHFSLEEAAELVEQIRPNQVFLVGMNCDSFLPHDEMNEKLRKEYGNIQLAHDGLVLYM